MVNSVTHSSDRERCVLGQAAIRLREAIEHTTRRCVRSEPHADFAVATWINH